MGLKAFQLNDCDIVVARSLEEAISWYLNETGVPAEEALDDPDEIEDLTASKMYTCEDPEIECDCELITFLEGIKRLLADENSEFPCVLCSTAGY